MSNVENINQKPLISVRNLKKYFPVKKKSIFQKEQYYVHANENISLDVYQGETLGVVGESGCGKSTFGRTIVQLYDQTDGSTLYYGNTIAEIAPKYVEEVIKTLSKQYPNYVEALNELENLEERLEEAKTSNERNEAQNKILIAKRNLNNRYSNILRIAGGLVVHNDLNEVSKALLNHYHLTLETTKMDRQIADLETSKTAEKVAENPTELQKIDKEIEVVQGKIAAKDQEIDKALEALNALRETARNHPDFKMYEARRNEGVDLSQLTTAEMRLLRKDLQFIFQDPFSSLNPRMTVGQIIGEGVVAHGLFKNEKSKGYNEYIQQIMEECGLAPYFIHRYPHQFSGGQRQRIGIARALALRPKFIVCDEAVSALDVSIQSQIINLLQDLKEEFGLTYLFITHDLSVVKYISDRIAVMYLGNVVELASSDTIFDNALHPYTKALLEAIPRTDVDGKAHELQILEGDIPSAVTPPEGCRFHTRCPYAFDRCYKFEPELLEIEENHLVACHLYDKQPEA